MPIKIAAAQIDIAFSEPVKNIERMTAEMAAASKAGADLIVFPECALTGYCFNSLGEAKPLAEPVSGSSCEKMAAACREYGIRSVFGMLEADGDRIFNACVFVGADGVIGSYRKIHLPFLGIDRFVTPGDRPFAVHAAGDIDLRLGMNICYDGSFPESARIMALQGADLIALPTNWPPGSGCTADYVINTRAMENAVYYIAVNRVGVERGFQFIGKSKICDVNGYTLAEANHENEEIFYAEIEPEKARQKRFVRVPDEHVIDRFEDRRPDVYGRLLEK